MPTTRFGLTCLLVYAVAQAVRDAFFGSLFQSISLFFVCILAFGGSTLVFGLSALRSLEAVRVLMGNSRLFLALNATTAASWLGYFFALKHLEPAIANTLHTGVGALAVLLLSALGLAMARVPRMRAIERIAHWGVFSSLLGVASVAVVGHSGFAAQEMAIRIGAITSATVGGVLIAISHMIARRFNDLGVGPGLLMAFRFPLVLVIAVVVELALGEPAARPSFDAVPLLALVTFGLIVMPSYFLQLGIVATRPITVNAIRALGPVFVFGVQQFDGRIHFSGATLACVLAFVFFATISGVMRGWAEAQETSR